MPSELVEPAYPVKRLPDFHVPKQGWHRVSISNGAAAIILAGYEDSTFVQVSVSARKPIFIKIPEGYFRVTGIGTLACYCEFQRLGAFSLFGHFFSKAVKHFKSGDSISALWKKGVQALDPKRTGFGSAQSLSQEVSPGAQPTLGPLALYELGNASSDVTASLTSKHLKVFVNCNDPNEANLWDQSYKNYTCDPSEYAECDLILRLHDGTRLLTNSLEALVQPFTIKSQLRVCYADVWLPRSRSFCFGFDPILNHYADTLSDLVIMTRDLDQRDGNLEGVTSEQIYRISRPLASATNSRNPLITGMRSPPPSPEPTEAAISCIIPTRDRPDLLANIIYGLLDNTDQVSQIIVIDNGSIEARTFALFDQLDRRGVIILKDSGDFNFSRLCNNGARVAKNSILAFINNDIEVVRRDWLSNMARWAVLPNVGAVGTRLLYSNNTLQHGGIALGLSGHSGHLFRNLKAHEIKGVPSLLFASQRSAVTGAALMVEASKFASIGGFDELSFPVSLNDVDLCLRLQAIGLSCIYEPLGEAIHMEGASRESDLTPRQLARRTAEVRKFIERWEAEINRELWFSSALSMAHEDVKLL